MPVAVLRKMIKHIGAPAGVTRISKGALKLFSEIVEEKARRIANGAVRIASHTGRRTVKREDVRLVVVKK